MSRAVRGWMGANSGFAAPEEIGAGRGLAQVLHRDLSVDARDDDVTRLHDAVGLDDDDVAIEQPSVAHAVAADVAHGSAIRFTNEELLDREELEGASLAGCGSPARTVPSTG